MYEEMSDDIGSVDHSISRVLVYYLGLPRIATFDIIPYYRYYPAGVQPCHVTITV